VNQELLRIVDSIARDKNIEKESIFADIEASLLSAARKFYGEAEDVLCTIDRMSGDIEVRKDGTLIDYREFGRIAAQTAKQVLIQKIREDERGSIYDEYAGRKGQIITGSVARFEGGALIVNLGRSEGFLPLIRRLFELEVPEVQEKVIEVKALAREAGYRTKIAVTSIDTKVDAVGACVGVRGSRIKNIVDELGGEKIDIVRWNESSQILITNSLKPAEIVEISLNFEMNRATVVVNDDQLSLAIGKRGQNVRLAARLTGWDIDILTPPEYQKGLDDLEKVLKTIEGVDTPLLDRMVALGVINLLDFDEMTAEPLVKELEVSQEIADKIVSISAVEAKRIAAEDAVRKIEDEKAKRIAEANRPVTPLTPVSEAVATLAEKPAAADSAPVTPVSEAAKPQA